MKRISGVLAMLVLLMAMLAWANPEKAMTWSNLKDVLNRQAFFGILTLGVGVLIITGGIDLSIGSVVGLSAISFGVLMRNGYSPYLATLIVLLGGAAIGALHAGLITKLNLQPFLVTLCGMFIYRGLARTIAADREVGYGSLRDDKKKTDDPELYEQFLRQYGNLREWFVGYSSDGVFNFPMMIIVLAVVALLVGIVLHKSVWGRYWYALGHSEQAAKYAGIRIDRNKFAVYILCSTLAALGGILYMLEPSSANASSTGSTWELYAITGAVLGGCSLRGGEGTVPGMVLGAAVLPLLENLINFSASLGWVQALVKSVDAVKPILVGLTLLIGTIADEYFRKRAMLR